MISEWEWGGVYLQRLKEEMFGLVSEGRGIRQTGVKKW